MKNVSVFSTIGQTCQVIAGQSPEGKFYNSNGEGLPFYQGKKEFREKFIGEPTVWTTQLTKEAFPGDILISVRAPVGPVNFSTNHICIGRGLAAIRPYDQLDKEYLYYYLTMIQPEIQGNAGAVFPSISKSQIEQIQIPLPPLEEQKRIVTLLDEAFAAIDKARENTERNIRNVKELFDSYLEGIFAHPGEGWEEKTLGELFVVERGGSPRPIEKYLTKDEDGINWIKIGDTKNTTKYIYSTDEKIKPEGMRKSRLVKPGDFLLTNSMSFGRPYIMKTTGCIHDGWLVIRPGQTAVDQDYLFYILSSKPVFNQFDSLAAGSTVRNLNIDLVKRVVIHLPPFQVQKTLALKFEEISNDVNKLETIYIIKQKSLINLKNAILNKAFNGE